MRTNVNYFSIWHAIAQMLPSANWIVRSQKRYSKYLFVQVLMKFFIRTALKPGAFAKRNAIKHSLYFFANKLSCTTAKLLWLAQHFNGRTPHKEPEVLLLIDGCSARIR